MTDLMLNIHPGDITVDDHQLNGEVISAEGAKLNNARQNGARSPLSSSRLKKGFRPGA